MAAKPFKIRVKPSRPLSVGETVRKYGLSDNEFAEVRHATAWLTIWQGEHRTRPRAGRKAGRVIAFESSKKK